MTVSSFTTVTLNPVPIVSFNIRLPSTTYQAIKKRGRFKIHVLAADERGAFVADLFTRGDAKAAFRELARRFDGWDNGDVLNGPRLIGQHVIAVLNASLMPEKCVEVGDHVIVIAEVFYIDQAKSADDVPLDRQKIGLMYALREYRGLGEAIERPRFGDGATVTHVPAGVPPYIHLVTKIEGKTGAA